MNLHQETRLKDALRTLRELSLELEINLLHNYGYRELLQISECLTISWPLTYKLPNTL